MDILSNTSIILNPFAESLDSGWSIDGQSAIHTSCNAGVMRNIGTAGLVVGKSYVVTYTISDYKNGGVRVNLGNTEGTTRNAPGTYSEELQVTGTPQISFYSDGALTILNTLSFYEVVDQVNNAVTLAFYDGEGTANKKWGTTYSYSPDLMIKFINSFFSVKDGFLWIHNSNPVRNNFYGQQYNSEIRFYDNLNPTTVKEYYSIRVQANTPWYCPNNGDITIQPVVGRANGMSSRLKKGNFKNYQGSFYADFMRNYLDSRFNDPEQALFKGEPLKGRYMELVITNKDITEAILFEIDIKSATSNITY